MNEVKLMDLLSRLYIYIDNAKKKNRRSEECRNRLLDIKERRHLSRYILKKIYIDFFQRFNFLASEFENIHVMSLSFIFLKTEFRLHKTTKMNKH